jgi:hypothetical protein
VERRRAALAGTGIGDPKNTGELLRISARNMTKAIPLLIKKYWGVGLIMMAGWLFLMTFNEYAWSLQVPAMAPVFRMIAPLVGFLIFITAAYNNWVAKSLYVLIIIKVFIPLFRRIKTEGLARVVDSFRAIAPGTTKSWEESSPVSASILVMLIGAGLAFSNFLTRNNASDKVLVSIAAALSLVKVLSDGRTSIPFMSCRVISKDFFKLFRKVNPVGNPQIYLGIEGLGAGLLCSIILMELKGPLGDTIGGNLGYFAGAGLLVIGIVFAIVQAQQR